jgi:hypothetical protein
VQNTFVLTLLLLEAGGNFSDEGRHVLFSATSSLMTFVLMVRPRLCPTEDVPAWVGTHALASRVSCWHMTAARNVGSPETWHRICITGL